MREIPSEYFEQIANSDLERQPESAAVPDVDHPHDTPESQMTYEQSEKTKFVIDVLLKNHFISFDNGNIIWNSENKIINYNNLRLGSRLLSRADLLQGLAEIKGYNTNDIVTDEYKRGELPPRSLAAMRESENDLSSNLLKKDDDAIVKLSELVSTSYGINKGFVSLTDGTMIPLARLRTAVDLERLGTTYNKKLGDPENQQRRNALSFLRKENILTYSDGRHVVDPEKIQSIDYRYAPIKKHDLIAALSGIKAYTKQQVEKEGFDPEKEQPTVIIDIPPNLQTLKNGTLTKSLIKPWEIGGSTSWDSSLVLESGEIVNMAELALVNALRELQARRDPETKQLYITGHNGKESKFSAYAFNDLSGFNPASNSDGKKSRISFRHSPAVFFKSMLPRLNKLGVFRLDDFGRTSGTEAADVYNVKTQRINSSGFVNFSNINGEFARYYLGKGNLIGTKIPVSEIEVCRITPETAGIFRKTHDKQRLLYTFDFITGDALAARQQQVIGIKEINPSSLSSRITFGENAVSKILKPYTATVSLDRRADESDQHYANRIAEFNDPSFVITTCKELFGDAGVGIHNLEWNEQLILARAVLEIPDRKRLIDFAKQYGIEGVRALTSADYTFKMSESILTIGEKLPDHAHAIFKRYSQLKDKTAVIAESVKQSEFFKKFAEGTKDGKGDFSEQLSEAILRRAKDMLNTAAGLAVQKSVGTVVYGSRELSVSKPTEVSKSLEVYADVLEKITCLMNSETNKDYSFDLIKSDESDVPSSYHFKVHNKIDNVDTYMTIQCRPYGAPLDGHNKEKEFDGEARINFLFSDVEMTDMIADTARQQALSFRIDREGKQRENGNIIANDPTADKGEVSLEIGGFGDNNDVSPSSMIGRVVSVGNALSQNKEARVGDAQYYHNRESFTQEFGKADTFAAMVEYVQAQIKNRYVDLAQVNPETKAAGA